MDLVGYLETLPKTAVSSLYTSSWTCQAVLRGLPPLAKLYALRMVYLEHPLSNSVVESWPKPEGASKHNLGVEKLKRLQILQEGSSRSGQTWLLQPDFRAHLRIAISTNGGSSLEAGVVSGEVAHEAPSKSKLDRHADNQWEGLCLYLVGSNDKPPKEAPYLGRLGWMDIDGLLESANLIAIDDSGERDCTEEGIQFLMLDTYHQLWLLLKQYTEAAAKRSGSRLARVVSFLLQLGCQGVGSPLSTEHFDDLQSSIAADLAQLGLLLPFKCEGIVWLSPTRLSLALSGGKSAEAQKEVTDGFILVETNYKVVAYTSSPLKRAILNQFVRCDVILPNAFVGTLTRESVTNALQAGIDHEMIIRYLTQHADPHTASCIPVVPAVVSDQVRLWQAETKRVRDFESHLYDNFESEQLFVATANQARLLGTWLWEDPEKQRLVAAKRGHERLREFIRSNK